MGVNQLGSQKTTNSECNLLLGLLDDRHGAIVVKQLSLLVVGRQLNGTTGVVQQTHRVRVSFFSLARIL